jgi:hypothetical protein
MDKNKGTIFAKLFLSMPKSINAMSDLEQKSKEIADKLVREEFRANPTSKEEFYKKRNAARENAKRELLECEAVKQEKKKSMYLVSKKIPPSHGYEKHAVNSNDLNKSAKPENTNQGITYIAKHENEKQADIFPNMPKRRNDWFDAIYAMTEIYHEKHGEIPSIGQAWSILWNDPPEGHKIATKTVLHINYLVMGGNDLSEKSFKKRWRNYTTSPNKGE